MKLTKEDKEQEEELGLNDTEMLIFKACKEVKRLEKELKNETNNYNIAIARLQSYIEMAKAAGTITYNPALSTEERIVQIIKMARGITL